MWTATDLIKAALAGDLDVSLDGQTKAFKQYRIGGETIRVHKSDSFCAALDTVAA